MSDINLEDLEAHGDWVRLSEVKPLVARLREERDEQRAEIAQREILEAESVGERERLRADNAALRADIERLTRELSEKTEAIQDAAKLIDRFRAQARRENESALNWEEKHNSIRSRIAYVSQQLALVDCGAAPVEELARRAAARIVELERDRERLAKENAELSEAIDGLKNL